MHFSSTNMFNKGNSIGHSNFQKKNYSTNQKNQNLNEIHQMSNHSIGQKQIQNFVGDSKSKELLQNGNNFLTNTNSIQLMNSNVSVPDFSNPLSNSNYCFSNMFKLQKTKNTQKNSIINSNISNSSANSASLFQNPRSLYEIAQNSNKQSDKIIKKNSQQYKEKQAIKLLGFYLEPEIQKLLILRKKNKKQFEKQAFQLVEELQTQKQERNLYQVYLQIIHQEILQEEESSSDESEYLYQNESYEQVLQHYLNQIYSLIQRNNITDSSPLGIQIDLFNINQYNQPNKFNVQSDNQFNVQIRGKTAIKSGKKEQKFNKDQQFQNLKKILIQDQQELQKRKQQEMRKEKINSQTKSKLKQIQEKPSQFQMILGLDNKFQNNFQKQKSQKVENGLQNIAKRFTNNLNNVRTQQLKIQIQNSQQKKKNPFSKLIKQNQQQIQNQLQNRDKKFSEKINNKNNQFFGQIQQNSSNSLSLQNKKLNTNEDRGQMKNVIQKNQEYQRFLVPQLLQPYQFISAQQISKKKENLQKEGLEKMPNQNKSQLNQKQVRKQVKNDFSQSLNKLTNFSTKTLSSNLPNTLPNPLPNTLPNNLPNTLSNNLPNTLPNNLSNTLPNNLPNNLPNTLQNSLPSNLPPNLPANIADNQKSKSNLICQPNKQTRTYYDLTGHFKKLENDIKANQNQVNPTDKTHPINFSNSLYSNSLNTPQIQENTQTKISNENMINIINHQSRNHPQQNFTGNSYFSGINSSPIQKQFTQNTLIQKDFNNSSNISQIKSNLNYSHQYAANQYLLNQANFKHQNYNMNNPPSEFCFQNFGKEQMQQTIYQKSNNVNNLKFFVQQNKPGNFSCKQKEKKDTQKQISKNQQNKQAIQRNIFKENQNYYQIQAKDFYSQVVSSIPFHLFIQSSILELKEIFKNFSQQNFFCQNYRLRYNKTFLISSKIKAINLTCQNGALIQNSLKILENQQQNLQNLLKQLEQQEFGQYLIQNHTRIKETLQFLQSLKTYQNNIENEVDSECLQSLAKRNSLLQLYSCLNLIEDQVRISNQQLEMLQLNNEQFEFK